MLTQKSQEFQEKQIIINGLQVNYTIQGSGPSLLILHGWGRGSSSYARVQEQLALAGFKVVIPDLPGFGRTSPPEFPWGVEEYVEFVFEFAKVLGLQKFALLGHSFGGQVALRFVVLHADMVERLILYGAAVIRREPSFKVKIIGYIAKGGNMVFSVWPLSMVQGFVRKALYKILGSNDERHSRGVMREVRKKILCKDLSAFLGEVKVPTHIIWGDQDRATPVEDAYILQEKIPQASLAIIPNAGHRIHQESPQEFVNSITSFLRPRK